MPGVDAQRIGMFLMAVLLAGTPVFVCSSFFHLFTEAKFIFAGFVLAACLASWAAGTFDPRRSRPARISLGPVFSVLLAFLAWSLLGYLLSPSACLVNRALAAHVAFVASFFFARRLALSRGARAFPLAWVMLAGALVALLSLVQYYGLDVSLLPRLRVAGLFDLSFLIFARKEATSVKLYSLLGHRNYVAGFLALCQLLCLFFLFRRPARHSGRVVDLLRRIAAFCCILLFQVVIVLTHTRGAWIGLAAGHLVFLLLLSSVPSEARPAGVTGRWAVLVLVLLGIFAAFGFGRTLNRMDRTAGQRIAALMDTDKGSVGERLLFNRTAWRIITADWLSFFCGKGIGSYPVHHSAVQAEILAERADHGYPLPVNNTWYVHNEVLNYWAETGLVGLSLLVTALLLLFGRLLSRLRGVEGRRGEGATCDEILFLCAAGAAMSAVLVRSLVSFGLHLPATALLFYALAGTVDAVSGKRRAGRPLVEAAPSAAPLVLLVTAFVIAFTCLKLSRAAAAEYCWKQAYQLREQGQVLRGTVEMAKARSWVRDLPGLEFDFARLLDGCGSHLAAGKVYESLIPVYTSPVLFNNLAVSAMARGDYRAAERWFERVFELAPLFRQSVGRYVEVLVRLGKPARASRILDLALRHRKADCRTLMYAGLFALADKDDGKALSFFDEALRRNPGLERVRALRRLVLGLKEGDPRLIRELARKACDERPGDPVLFLLGLRLGLAGGAFAVTSPGSTRPDAREAASGSGQGR